VGITPASKEMTMPRWPVTLEGRLNSISKQAGGGKVTITLPSWGADKYYVHVFPTNEQARETLKDLPPRSYSIAETQEAFDKAKEKAIAVGTGHEIDEAVSDIKSKLDK
jgi:hypothetical protein